MSKLLDLFCGEGLAACGYWLSGRFLEIVGVDTNPDVATRYSFDFICCDAMTLDYDFLSRFDFIHASPPCQAYSHLTPDPSRHLRLVADTKLMLYASGKPHCIENVENAKKDLKPNIGMDGHYFGLPMERRRYFYLSTLSSSIQLMKTGKSITIHGGDYVSRADLIRAFGLDCISTRQLAHLTRAGIEQGVPPAMTRWIAERAIPAKPLIGLEAARPFILMRPGGASHMSHVLVAQTEGAA